MGISKDKLNPKGGAIALGHPLGCTGNIFIWFLGSRQIATLLPELLRQNKKLGVVSMCIGTGMGAAALIEREWAHFWSTNLHEKQWFWISWYKVAFGIGFLKNIWFKILLSKIIMKESQMDKM